MVLSYNPEELGGLQQEVLKHLFSCPEKSENISHVSKVLGKLQPSVQRSVDYLVEKKYVKKGDKYTKGKKEITLTQKGLAAALVYGAKIEQLNPYFKKHDKSFYEQLQQFRKLFISSEKSDFYARKTAQFFLDNDLFDEGNIKNRNTLTEDQILKMNLYQLNAVIEFFHSVDFGKKTKNIGEFFDRLKIDRDVMKKYLLGRKAQYEWALSEIDKKDKKGTEPDPAGVT